MSNCFSFAMTSNLYINVIKNTHLFVNTLIYTLSTTFAKNKRLGKRTCCFFSISKYLNEIQNFAKPLKISKNKSQFY